MKHPLSNEPYIDQSVNCADRYNLHLRNTINPLSAHSNQFKPGDTVRVLQPDYIAGSLGIVCDREVLSSGEMTDRWLIRVEPGNIVVSLTTDEFILLTRQDET